MVPVLVLFVARNIFVRCVANTERSSRFNGGCGEQGCTCLEQQKETYKGAAQGSQSTQHKPCALSRTYLNSGIS